MVNVYLLHLSGVGVHLVLVFHPVQDELHFVVPIVQVVVFLYELHIAAAYLSGYQILRCCGVDISFIAIGIIVVVLTQGYRLGSDLIRLHCDTHGGGQVIQEVICGIGRASLQLQYDIALMASHGGVKIAGSVNLIHQLPHHGGAGPALITGVTGQYRPAVVVEGIQGHHIASIVIIHLDLRVHAEKDGAHAGRCFLLSKSTGAYGHGVGRAGIPTASGESGEGEGSGEAESHQSTHILFHECLLL